MWESFETNSFCFFSYKYLIIFFETRSRTGDSLRAKHENYGLVLAFDVNEFFSFGSPLSLILAYRRMLTDSGKNQYWFSFDWLINDKF